MSTDQNPTPNRSFWHRVWQILWALRFAYVVAAIVGGTVWVLLPLRDAAALPAPPLPPFTPEPPDLQETLVLGPTTYAPGTQGAARVLVHDPRAGKPLSDIEVHVALAPRDRPDMGRELYAGHTDEYGTAQVRFDVPGDVVGEWALVVDVIGDVGKQRVVRPITVRRDVDLWVAADKAVYYPGQVVHLWARAVRRIDGLPVVGEPVALTLLDARGNRVCAQTEATSAYGTVYASCALADLVNTGTYRLVATAGDVVAEHQVTVEAQRPLYSVEILPERPYYVLGTPVEAIVLATYPHGEPVAKAEVEVYGVAGESEAVAFRVRGQTDESGAFAFVADPPFDNNASSVRQVRLVASVVDERGNAGKGDAWLPVAVQPLWIAAWPESGALKPGLENQIHLRVLYPDGRPATCELAVDLPGIELQVTVQTDAAGQARVRHVPLAEQPVAMTVHARDASGQEARAKFDLPVAEGRYHLLLRPDREKYRSGEGMRVDVYALGVEGAIYLDLSIDGQYLAAYSAPVVDGYAAFDLMLPDNLSGPFELNAYGLLADGTLVRDARQVIVESLRLLDVSFEPDRAQYRPGDTAQPVVRVVDERGRGVRSELGVGTVVGWATRSREGNPGFTSSARAAVPAVDLRPQYAETVSKDRPVPESVQSQFDTYQAVWAKRRQALTVIAERILWGVLVLPGLLWIVVLIGARVQGLTLRSLGGGLLGGILALPLVVGAGALLALLGRSLLDTGAVVALGMAWFGVLVALFVHGCTHRDGWTHLVLGLVASALVLGAGLRYALVLGDAPAFPLIVSSLGALGVMTLALWVFGVGKLRRRELGGGVTALAAALTLVCTFVGATLTERGGAVPIQEPLPATTRTFDRSIPTPVQPNAPVVNPAFPADQPPFTTAEWTGETILWAPGTWTDEGGSLVLDVPLAHAPRDVYLWTLAFTKEGAWGQAETRLPVREPLSVEPVLPLELTVGDSLDLPVVVRNALPISQTVRLTVTQASWFRVRKWGADVQQIEVPAGGTGELVLPIQVREWASQTLELTVQGDGWSDVISRSVTVRPNGKWIARAYSWWIGDWVRYKFRIPWSAVRGTDQIAVKLYPGNWSVLEGALERAVHGTGNSFDEVAAAMQARLLYAAYLRRTGRWAGERRADLERALAFDYQRLLAFEVPGGGFSAFGTEPANLYRSALALRCLSELGTYHPVDAELLDLTALWLFRQQAEQGTWQFPEMLRAWSMLPRPELLSTAYVAWALIDAGYGDVANVTSAVQYLERDFDKAEDPYTLALIANALAAYGEPTDALDATLASLAERVEISGKLAYWPSRLQTLSGAAGSDIEADGYRTPSGKVESVALATLALSRAHVYPEQVTQGLAMLTDSRDVFGTWNAPQSTVLALRAFLAALPEEGTKPDEVSFTSTISVTVDEIAADPAVLRGDVGRVLVFDELSKGYNDVEIAVRGDEIAYQIVGSYYLPWNQVPSPLPEEEDLSIEVSYDRTVVTVGETITATVDLMLNRPGVAPLVALELGLAPGLDLVVGDLDDLVANGTIARYQRAGERIAIYLLNLSSEQPLRFSYRLRARFPLAVMTQPTYAVDVANPQRPAVRAPIEIEVIGGGR